MSTALVAQALTGLLGLTAIIWLLLKTRTARAADWSGSIKIVRRRLRAEGASEDECLEIIKESAKQHLGLPDPPPQPVPSPDPGAQ